MDKRRVLLVVDVAVVSLFLPLLSWRLTGLSLHEGIGIALLVPLLAHAAVHWGRMETIAHAVLRRAPRRMGELVVNAGLFVALGATLISGIVISKVLWPNTLLPSAYLGWHGLHDSATTMTMVFAGLHLALNWDRLVALVKHRTGPVIMWRRPRAGVALRRALGMVLATGVLAVTLLGYERATRRPREVLMVFSDGRRELRTPPPDITRYHADADQRRVAGGAVRLAFSALVIVGVAGTTHRIGRARRRATAYRQMDPESRDEP